MKTEREEKDVGRPYCRVLVHKGGSRRAVECQLTRQIVIEQGVMVLN